MDSYIYEEEEEGVPGSEDIENEEDLKCCYYCGNDTISDLVKCVNKGCNQYFCNLIQEDLGKSHIYYHLVTRNHNEVVLAVDEYELYCFICESRNIFTLVFEEFDEHSLNDEDCVDISIICRNLCLNSEESFKQKKLRPIIEEDSIVSLFVTQNGTGRTVSSSEIMIIEEGLSKGLIKNTDSVGPSYLRKIKKTYETVEEYIEIFQTLLDHEMEYETAEQVSETERTVVPIWREDYKQFSFQFNEEQTKFKNKEEVMVKGLNFSCKGVVNNSGNRREIVVSLLGGRTGYEYLNQLSIKCVFQDIAYSRMTRALKSFKKIDEKLRNFLLGYDIKLPVFLVKEKNDFTAPGLPKLNESQNKAVRKALESAFCLIQGPPGTGKTITTASIVYHLSKEINSPSKFKINKSKYEELNKTFIEKYEIVNEYYEIMNFQKKIADCIKVHQANRPKFEWKMQACQKAVDGIQCEINKIEKERDVILEEMEKVNFLLQDLEDDTERKRVLVTAPSNIAVDHLVIKIAQTGLKVVRFYSKSKEEEDSEAAKYSFYRLFLKELEKPENSKMKELFYLKKNSALNKGSSALYHEQERRIRDSILKEVHVICTTCVGAFDHRLSGLRFSKVVIDEACQSREPESLIPLMFRPDQIIMVGDHHQLGPVIKSKSAESAGLKNSLFQRMVDLGRTPYMLQWQYRMHPDISEFPCKTIYDNSLNNGVDSSDRTDLKNRFNWPGQKKQFFCHIDQKEELSSTGKSYLNRGEAEMVVNLVNKIGLDADIGVITFYDAQRVTILSYFNGRVGPDIEIASVDSFQGREKDYIILSCVRSNDRSGVGFLGNYRRLNVAITRARYGLIICGNAETLCKSPIWRALVNHFIQNNLIFVCNKDRFIQKYMRRERHGIDVCHEVFSYADL